MCAIMSKSGIESNGLLAVAVAIAPAHLEIMYSIRLQTLQKAAGRGRTLMADGMRLVRITLAWFGMKAVGDGD